MDRKPEAAWRLAPLADPTERIKRAGLLAADRLAPLEAYRVALLPRWPRLPHFDPLDSGIGARLLLLLESPAPGADEVRFVSRDNATGTARNLRRFLPAAGLPRAETLLWNTVPGILHAPGARNRAPRAAEVAAGLAELPALLRLLPGLRVVVLAGRVAAQAAPVLRAERPGLAVLAMPHPSPVHVNTAPGIAPAIVRLLTRAAAKLAG